MDNVVKLGFNFFKGEKEGANMKGFGILGTIVIILLIIYLAQRVF